MSRSSRRRAAAVLVLVASTALVAGGTAEASGGPRVDRPKVVPSKDSTFAGANTGAIPDATPNGGSCGTATTPGTRTVTFAVSGVVGPVSDVSVSVTLAHTWGADVALTLVAPDATSQSVMTRPTATSGTSCGSANDWAGTYTFHDQATQNFWTALAAGSPAAPGSYRAGGTAFDSTPVALTTPFTSVADPNGTWTLRVQDYGVGQTGTISAAALTLRGKDFAPCTAASARTAAAQAAVKSAVQRAAKARSGLRRAKAALAKAKRSGTAAQVKEARRHTKKAKARRTRAEAALTAARTALAAAAAAQAAVC